MFEKGFEGSVEVVSGKKNFHGRKTFSVVLIPTT